MPDDIQTMTDFQLVTVCRFLRRQLDTLAESHITVDHDHDSIAVKHAKRAINDHINAATDIYQTWIDRFTAECARRYETQGAWRLPPEPTTRPRLQSGARCVVARGHPHRRRKP